MAIRNLFLLGYRFDSSQIKAMSGVYSVKVEGKSQVCFGFAGYRITISYDPEQDTYYHTAHNRSHHGYERKEAAYKTLREAVITIKNRILRYETRNIRNWLLLEAFAYPYDYVQVEVKDVDVEKGVVKVVYREKGGGQYKGVVLIKGDTKRETYRAAITCGQEVEYFQSNHLYDMAYDLRRYFRGNFRR